MVKYNVKLENINVHLGWVPISPTAVVKDTPIPQHLEMPSFTAPKHLDPTIYPTGVGVRSVSGREGESQMLSTAIKVTLDPKRNVKVSLPQTLDYCCKCKSEITRLLFLLL